MTALYNTILMHLLFGWP